MYTYMHSDKHIDIYFQTYRQTNTNKTVSSGVKNNSTSDQ